MGRDLTMRIAILSVCVLVMACTCEAVSQQSSDDTVQQLSPLAKTESQGLLDAINQGIQATKNHPAKKVAAPPAAASKDASAAAKPAAAKPAAAKPAAAKPADSSAVQSLHDEIKAQSKALASTGAAPAKKAITDAAPAKKARAPKVTKPVHHNSHFKNALGSMQTHYCQTAPHKLRCDTATQLSKHFASGGNKSNAPGLDKFLQEVHQADCGKLNGGSTFCKALEILVRHEHKN